MILHRSSLFAVPHDKLPLDKNGKLLSGYVLATAAALPLPPDDTFDFPRHVLHAAPGVPAPAVCSLVIVDGSQTPWPAEAVAAAWPNGAKYVLDATWPDVGPMGPFQRRGKVIEVPEDVTPTATNLVPHAWAGDAFEPAPALPA